MNVPKTPDHKLIGALRILANDAMRGAVDLNVLPAVLYEVADRLAELTQPQPIETALKSEHVLLFGGELHDDETGEVYQNDSCVIAYRDYSMWHLRFGDVLVVNPTHWLPCVKVDPASLGGQVDEE
jgi:hypothetical protein